MSPCDGKKVAISSQWPDLLLLCHTPSRARFAGVLGCAAAVTPRECFHQKIRAEASGEVAMSTTDTPVASAAFQERVAPGVKITAQMSPEPREQDVAFIRQMGVEHVVLWTDATKSSAEY